MECMNEEIPGPYSLWGARRIDLGMRSWLIHPAELAILERESTCILECIGYRRVLVSSQGLREVYSECRTWDSQTGGDETLFDACSRKWRYNMQILSDSSEQKYEKC